MAELKQMLLTMHPNTKALAKAFANNILAGFAGEGEEVDAANPYGCNQYGEGWRMPHNGRASKAGAPVKKSDPTEEERKQKAIEELRRQAEQKRKEIEERNKRLNALNEQPFDNDRSGIEIRTGLDATEIAALLNKIGYRYGSQRQEKARAWEGYYDVLASATYSQRLVGVAGVVVWREL